MAAFQTTVRFTNQVPNFKCELNIKAIVVSINEKHIHMSCSTETLSNSELYPTKSLSEWNDSRFCTGVSISLHIHNPKCSGISPNNTEQIWGRARGLAETEEGREVYIV